MKEKLKALAADDRSYLKRLRSSLLVCFAVSFTFLVFGMLDLYLTNAEILGFSFYDLLWPTLGLGAAICIVPAPVLALFRGKYFDFFLSLALGVVLAGYIQGNFLNLDFGALTGDPIPWGEYRTHGFINAGIWILMILLPFALRLINNKAWKIVTVLLPVLLIGMQGAALVSSIASADLTATSFEEGSPKFLSERGMLAVSADENIIVIVLDRMDESYIEKIVEDDPGFFDNMDGFTRYTNHTSLYSETYPSITCMLTGKTNQYDIPATRYFEEAYTEGRFLPALKENGFTTKLYLESYTEFSEIEQLSSVADNVYSGDARVIVESGLLYRMVRFSAYRYAPHIIKSKFWMTPISFDRTYQFETSNGEETFDYSNNRFRDKLKNEGVRVTEEKKNFMFLHLLGFHTPYLLDENGNDAKDTDLLNHSKGLFLIIFEYLEELKNAGVYENAAIMITGDHGACGRTSQIEDGEAVSLFYKPPGESGALQTTNKPVSQENFRATVMQAAGLDETEFGRSILDVNEEETPVRKFFFRTNAGGGGEHFLKEYEIIGDAKDFSSWKAVKDHDILYDR